MRNVSGLGLLKSSSVTAAPISRSTSAISSASSTGNEYTSFAAIAFASDRPPSDGRPVRENAMRRGGRAGGEEGRAPKSGG